MNLNFKVFCLVMVWTFSGGALALSKENIDFLTVKKVELKEVVIDDFNQEQSHLLHEKDIEDEVPTPDPIEQYGKVIKLARDIVALGEEVYKLVSKGRPSTSTKYAPISVIPTVNGEPVDLLSTEGWSAPTKRTYEINYYNLYNMNVVKFRFTIIFAYNGSYDGKGAYITSAQIIPNEAHALFGYDFGATMKLGGIQNNGTKANPIAGATLLIEHTVNTLVKASISVDTFFITGKGEIQKY